MTTIDTIDDYEVHCLEERRQRATKLHGCDVCWGVILPGTLYIRYAFRDDIALDRARNLRVMKCHIVCPT